MSIRHAIHRGTASPRGLLWKGRDPRRRPMTQMTQRHDTAGEMPEDAAAMAEEIQEGRDLFKSRVTPEIYEENIYDRAIVDVLVKSKGHVKSKIW